MEAMKILSREVKCGQRFDIMETGQDTHRFLPKDLPHGMKTISGFLYSSGVVLKGADRFEKPLWTKS